MYIQSKNNRNQSLIHESYNFSLEENSKNEKTMMRKSKHLPITCTPKQTLLKLNQENQKEKKRILDSLREIEWTFGVFWELGLGNGEESLGGKF